MLWIKQTSLLDWSFNELKTFNRWIFLLIFVCLYICTYWLLESKLFYLDPHQVQPFIDFSSIIDNTDDSFHCAYPSYMDVSQLDPSIAIVCILMSCTYFFAVFRMSFYISLFILMKHQTFISFLCMIRRKPITSLVMWTSWLWVSQAILIPVITSRYLICFSGHFQMNLGYPFLPRVSSFICSKRVLWG